MLCCAKDDAPTPFCSIIHDSLEFVMMIHFDAWEVVDGAEISIVLSPQLLTDRVAKDIDNAFQERSSVAMVGR